MGWFGPGYVQRCMFAFATLTVLSLTLDGLWLGATDYGTLQTMTWFSKYEIFGWAIPLAALGGFIASLPQMLLFDYSWLQSLGAAGLLIRLLLSVVVSIGFVWGFLGMIWPIIAQVAVALARGAVGLLGRL